MADRFVVSGVQLGILIGIDNGSERKDFVEEIVKSQYIGHSETPLIIDCKVIAWLFGAKK